MKQKRCAEL